MPVFITRVELRGVEHDGKEYEKLHALMEAKEFCRVVPVGGAWFHLPPAEYSRRGDRLTLDQAHQDALTAAKGAQPPGKEPAIFVSQIDDYRQSGLLPADPPRQETKKAVIKMSKKLIVRVTKTPSRP